MKRSLVFLLVVGATTALVAGSASAAIRITRINFDPSGPDDDSNLIHEHVVIKNLGDIRLSIRGWRIHDAGRDHVYRFGRIRLHPRQCAIVVTGKGDDFQR